MRNVTRLLRYLRDYKAQIALYFFTNLLAVLFSLFSLTMLAPIMQVIFKDPAAGGAPTSTGSGIKESLTQFINTVMLQDGVATALAYVCVAAVVFTMLKNLFLYISLRLLNPLRNSILRKLRDDMFTKTLSLPIGFFTEEKKGDLISRMTNDISEVEYSIVSVLEVFIREPLTILFFIIAMVVISPQLTVFLIIFLPIAGWVIGRISKSLKKSSNLAQEQLGSMLGVIDETLGGMRIIKAFNAEKHLRLRFMQINNLLFRTRNKIAARRDLASPMSETMGVFVVSIILWYGGRLVISGDSSFQGEWFLTYIALFTQIINPFKNLSAAFYNVQKGTAALERIEHLLAVENTIVELPNAKHISSFERSIEFRNVSFYYGDKAILHDIDLTIEKGKTIALVGASGAGKSTLVDLVPRFHDVTNGEVLIDGENIKDYRIDDLRRLMGVVSQEPVLFNDSLQNNIMLGTGGATAQHVEEAARIAHAHDFISNKANGYQTNVGDRGSKLSGGERQRITIARAILKNPPILILDEATSSLDTQSERIVQEAINKLMQNRTCIVIAHRLSTVRHADEIIVLDGGHIVQRGTHDALLAQDGLYRNLVEMQQVK